MRDDEKTRLEKMVRANESKPKRTTIILDSKERDFIDYLIREKKESGIKSLISKMLNIYKNMMISDWRFPGEYYFGISRIAFVNVELITILLNEIPKEKWHKIGQEMGRVLKISMETTLNNLVLKKENWEILFKRLSIQGFGDFFLKDKYILIKRPLISYSELWKGILEGLLEIRLETKTTIPPLVFQIEGKTVSYSDN